MEETGAATIPTQQLKLRIAYLSRSSPGSSSTADLTGQVPECPAF
jgi:hypothetical protein